MSVVALGDLAFNPDGATIAVGSTGGGSWWTYPNGLFGSGDGRLCLTCRPRALQEVVSYLG
jgi:hypothetical protein